MFNGTPETDKLCREMAELCEGVCVFGFSGGKDGLAAWLYLRNYFERIIPYHLYYIPGLKFIERSLKYYEDFFETKIERYLMWEGLPQLLYRGSFQTKRDWETIKEAGDFWFYSHRDVGYMVAEKHGLPHTWVGLGFSMYDSLDRIKWVRDCKGKHDKHDSFYPCWNWKTSQILEYISQNNCSLGEDYLISGRSFTDVLDLSMLCNMRDKYPEDFETVKKWFPLIEARIARNEFRKKLIKVS